MSAPTILLLDDDEVLRQVLRRVLSRQGLNVVEAGDLAQARQVLANQPCQVGLFDLCLPDGDGVELARELQEAGSSMPLILMTAYPLRLREQPNLAEKFTRVLSKPVNLQELRDAVDAAVAGAPAAAPLAATTPTQPAAASATLPMPAPPAPQPPTLTRAEPAPSPPVSGGYFRPALYALFFVAVAGVAVLILFPETHKFFDWNKAEGAEPTVRLESVYTARAVPGDPDGLELSPAVVEVMKVRTEPVTKATAHRPLELAGSLALDPDKINRVRSRFPGEVIEIADTTVAAPTGTTRRPWEFGDHITKGQLLGVLYSSSLGEKKSELVDDISQLRLDQENLEGIEALWKRGGTTEVVVRQARRNVEQDRIAIAKVERTLTTWQVSDEEIDEVRKEADKVIARGGERDKEKEKRWARVDLLSRIDGTVLEKNISVGEIVDTTTVLFQIADMRTMKVWVNVPEEDLPALRAAQDAQAKEGKKLTWRVTFPSDPNLPPAEGEIVAISPLIDPTQHTAIMMGWVNNDKGYLRSSQFVKATIELSAPKNTVSVPTAAVLEDGTESVVLVQPDPTKNIYTLKRVIVTQRFSDRIHVRAPVSAEEKKQGYSGLEPGELVVTQSALEMRSALDDVKAKAGK